MSLNLDWLITFQRLAREKSFSETAISLGLAQPTVTMRLKKLEEETGHILVCRAGNDVTLTEAGKIFLSYANRILRVLDVGKEDGCGWSQSEAPLIRLTATSIICTYLLPHFLSHWYQHHPHIPVSVACASTKEIIDMVQDGICDFGIVRGTTFSPTLQAVQIYHDPVVLAVSHHHPLGSMMGDSPSHLVSLTELVQEPLVVYQSNSWTTIEKWFLSCGLIPRVVAEVCHVATAKRLIQSGIGIGFLPYSTIKDEYETGQMNMIPLKPCEPLAMPTQVISRQSFASLEWNLLFLQSLIEYTHSFPVARNRI